MSQDDPRSPQAPKKNPGLSDTVVDPPVARAPATLPGHAHPNAADENTVFEGVTTAERFDFPGPPAVPNDPAASNRPHPPLRELEAADTVFDATRAVPRDTRFDVAPGARPDPRPPHQGATLVMPLPSGKAPGEQAEKRPVTARHQLTTLGGFAVAPRENPPGDIARTLESVYSSSEPAVPKPRPREGAGLNLFSGPSVPQAMAFRAESAERLPGGGSVAETGGLPLTAHHSEPHHSEQGTAFDPLPELSPLPALPSGEQPALDARPRYPVSRTSTAKRGLAAATFGLLGTALIVLVAVGYREFVSQEETNTTATAEADNAEKTAIEALRSATPPEGETLPAREPIRNPTPSDRPTTETAARTGGAPRVPAPVSGLSGQLTAEEKQAAEYLMAGRVREAHAAYRALAAQHPDRVDYQSLLRILDQKLAAPAARE